MLHKHVKAIAAALKEAFDAMLAHSVAYPNTKAPMASAARQLRPAAKNLLAAAKGVNETPGTLLSLFYMVMNTPLIASVISKPGR